MTNIIRDNIVRIQSDIADVCRSLGRNPQDITLVAVTKFAPVSLIEQAIDSGMIHIGENKVQEGLKKYQNLKSASGPSVTRHLIGHLQTNKVKDALKVFELIQSVDSLKLAQEIEKQARKLNRSVDILVQINTSGEEQKFGSDKTQALALIDDVAKLTRVNILGLMTIAPLTEDQKIIRDCFRQLREIRDQVQAHCQNQKNVRMKFLSMGMSGDYRIALEEGSNMVRIGRAIFAGAQEAESSTVGEANV